MPQEKNTLYWYRSIKDHQALVIFIISAAFTAGAIFLQIIEYFYWLGVFSYWELPVKLIKIDTSSEIVFSRIFVTLSFLLCILLLFYFLKLFRLEKELNIQNKEVNKYYIEKKKNINFSALILYFFTFVFLILFLIILNVAILYFMNPSFNILQTIIQTVFLMSIQYFYARLLLKFQDGPKQKKSDIINLKNIYIKEDNKIQYEKEIGDMQDKLNNLKVKLRKLKPKFIVIFLSLLLLFIVPFYCYYNGRNDQYNKSYFFIAKNYDDKIIVYQDDLKYILISKDFNKVGKMCEVISSNNIGILSYVKIDRN